LQNDPLKKKEIISFEDNKFPKGITPLERTFLSSDVSNQKKNIEEESKRKIGNIILVNIGTQEELNILKIGDRCLEQEKQKFTNIVHEFQDVFAWSYENLCGFDPIVIQHAIPIKEAKQ